jgi:hypothetical protein
MAACSNASSNQGRPARRCPRRWRLRCPATGGPRVSAAGWRRGCCGQARSAAPVPPLARSAQRTASAASRAARHGVKHGGRWTCQPPGGDSYCRGARRIGSMRRRAASSGPGAPHRPGCPNLYNTATGNPARRCFRSNPSRRSATSTPTTSPHTGRTAWHAAPAVLRGRGVRTAFFVVHDVAVLGHAGDGAVRLRSVMPALAAMSRSRAPGSRAMHSGTRAWLARNL